MNNLNPIYLQEEKKIVDNSDVTEDLLPAGLGAAAMLTAPSMIASGVAAKFGTNNFPQIHGPDRLPYNLNNLKVHGNQNIADYLRQKNIKVTTRYGSSAYFNPASNSINLDIKPEYQEKWAKPIFAHELGHSVKLANQDGQIPGNVYAYSISKNVSGASAVAQLINCFNKDDESRQRIGKEIALAGGLSAIPMVAEEIGASMRGSEMLGLQGAEKGRAFVGIASYVTWALSPTIIYFVSEHTRRILRALRKSRKEHPELEQDITNLKKEKIKVKV